MNNHNIPPLDLSRQYQQIGNDINQVVLDVLASGRYINGPIVEEFENQFANYIGTTNSIVCNSGTDALYLALRAFNIGQGDEVITTPFTFIATAEVISLVGAKPVFVDIDPHTFNIDPQKIAAVITDKTKAIIPVHLFGLPANMTEIMAIANAHNLIVIEDCAQATGAMWQDQKVGNIGHIGCFSFFPTKNLGACGDGGAITTNNPEIAAKIRIIREHGSPVRYYHEVVGVNSRLDAIQAAILQVKLRYLDVWNAQREKVAKYYQDLLSPLEGKIKLPQIISQGVSVWNQYTIRVIDDGNSPVKTLQSNGLPYTYRDIVREKLQQMGISSMVYYPLALHLQPVYKFLGYKLGDLPITEQISDEVLSLPMFPELLPEEQERIVYSLKEIIL